MDLYHCAVVEGDVAIELQKYLGISRRTVVGHIRIVGVPGRHEPETRDLNFDPLFDLAEQSNFKGWIGLEYRPMDGTTEGLNWLRRRSSDSLHPPLSSISQDDKEL